MLSVSGEGHWEVWRAPWGRQGTPAHFLRRRNVSGFQWFASYSPSPIPISPLNCSQRTILSMLIVLRSSWKTPNGSSHRVWSLTSLPWNSPTQMSFPTKCCAFANHLLFTPVYVFNLIVPQISSHRIPLFTLFHSSRVPLTLDNVFISIWDKPQASHFHELLSIIPARNNPPLQYAAVAFFVCLLVPLYHYNTLCLTINCG